MTPAELLACALDLDLAKRRAVGRRGALLGRRAIADDGAAGDERRPVDGGARILDGKRDRLRIVAVDLCRMPARRPEALELVVGHRKTGRPIDGDLVVVEQNDQAAELEMTRKRDRLLAQALHEAAVAGDNVSVMAHEFLAIAAVEQPLGESHADGIAKPLPQRAGGGLDAGRMAIFGMAGGTRSKLAETLELLQIHARDAGEVKQRIEQHRAVTG